MSLRRCRKGTSGKLCGCRSLYGLYLAAFVLHNFVLGGNLVFHTSDAEAHRCPLYRDLLPTLDAVWYIDHRLAGCMGATWTLAVVASVSPKPTLID